MLYVYTIVLIIVMILPAVVIIPQAFTSLNYFKFPVEETSFKWFEKFFDNEQWVVGLGRSMMIAVLAAVLATVIGTMGALAMNKLNFKGKSVFMSIMIAPVGAFFKVTLPTVKTSVVSSVLFAFVTSLDEVVVTTFVSGANTKTLTMVMWENMRTNIDPTLAVAALFMIILTLGMYIIKEVVEARSK